MIALLFMVLPVLGLPLIDGSAFLPGIDSRLSTGFLQEPDAYAADNPLPLPADLPLTQGKLKVFRRALATYTYRDSALAFASEMNVFTGYEQMLAEDDNYGFQYTGLRFRGRLNRNFSMQCRFWSGEFFGDLDAAAGSELIDSWYKTQESILILDNLSADMTWRSRKLGLSLGRGKFQVGNSISGSIILSDQVNDYGYLLAEGKLGKFSISLLHGSLVPDSTSVETGFPSFDTHNYPDKYVALHQLSYSPTDRLTLFGGETIVYGNRSLDVNYLLPVAFWRITEHNLRDRDDVLIYVGSTFETTRNTTLYFQIALDEMSPERFFSNWWGNKYALQGGLSKGFRLLDPSLAEPARLTFEATAVRPWTYTHYMNTSMYSHDGRTLGYTKGSNLLDLSTELNLPLPLRLSFDAGFSFCRQGSYGSDWRESYLNAYAGQASTDATADWFQGDITNTFSFLGAISYQPFDCLRIKGGLKSTKIEDWKHELSLSFQFSY